LYSYSLSVNNSECFSPSDLPINPHPPAIVPDSSKRYSKAIA